MLLKHLPLQTNLPKQPKLTQESAKMAGSFFSCRFLCVQISCQLTKNKKIFVIKLYIDAYISMFNINKGDICQVQMRKK